LFGTLGGSSRAVFGECHVTTRLVAAVQFPYISAVVAVACHDTGVVDYCLATAISLGDVTAVDALCIGTSLKGLGLLRVRSAHFVSARDFTAGKVAG
jgi:hypothetical protein